ncbi:restriction endonuclease subunit S [Gordonia sihwensis]|uniref:restriction endonuclease subunit S n=1 Tax=Gordonia sihwensis TaxID=173559 RepID=UPI003D95F36D
MTSTVCEGWTETDLGSASVILDNLRVPLSGAQRASRPGPFPYCGANGVLDHIDDYMIDDDVVLLAEDGGNFDQWRTRPIAYRMKGKIWVNNHAHVLKAAKTGDTGFLFYALQHKDITPFISSGTRSKLTRGELVRIKLLMPEAKEEQRRISDSLRDVDDLIATLERLIAKKQAIKQGMMQQLLTGRTRLPGFASPWSELSLGSVARIKTGSRNNQDKQAGGKYPFFVRSATVERIDSYSHDCEAILVPGEGGIGSIFHYINGKFEVHQRVYKISDFAPNASGRFIYYFMRQYFGVHAMENSVKATVDSLRLPTFKNFQLRLPSRDEQDAIVCILDDAEAEVAALKARLAKARAIKAGMMQQLLTGRTRLPLESVS